MPTNQELDVPRHNYHTTVHHIANNFANYEGHNILELAFLCQYVQARDLPTIVNSPDLPARIEKIKASPGFDPVKSFEKFYRNIGPELRPAIIFEGAIHLAATSFPDSDRERWISSCYEPLTKLKENVGRPKRPATSAAPNEDGRGPRRKVAQTIMHEKEAYVQLPSTTTEQSNNLSGFRTSENASLVQNSTELAQHAGHLDVNNELLERQRGSQGQECSDLLPTSGFLYDLQASQNNELSSTDRSAAEHANHTAFFSLEHVCGTSTQNFGSAAVPTVMDLVQYGVDSAVYKSPSGPLTLPYEDYTIAWICALHIEMAAASAMLDDRFSGLPRSAKDNNTYVLGRIGLQNVVISCLPHTRTGTTTAANVMANLQRTFPAIRLALMVRVGGGVPTKTDIRLGDVVVGTSIIQYDFGKVNKNGTIQRTASPRIPHHLPGTLISTLRSKHELQPNQISFTLDEKLGRYPKFGRPSLPDLLFQMNYDHESPTPACHGCDQSKLVLRSERASADPVVHYGAIASGNQVMKDSITRDNIAKQLDVLCFEMEGAGLMDILPCLIIRGICDYSDSHKTKGWQRYAAATAAAYAVELLDLV